MRLTVSLVTIGALIHWLGGFESILGVVAHVRFGFVALVIVLTILDRVLMTYKWLWLLDRRGLHFPLFQGVKLYSAATLWGLFLPTTVGPDAIRAVALSRAGLPGNEVLASIAIERITGFLAALLFALASLCLLSSGGFLPDRFFAVWWSGIALLAAAIVITLTSFSDSAFHVVHDRLLSRLPAKRIAGKLRALHIVYRSYRRDKGGLFFFFCLTMLEQLQPILSLWLTSLALGMDGPLYNFAMTVPACILIARLPIGIQGIGTFESAFAFALHLVGRSGAEALAITLSSRILGVLTLLPVWAAHTLSPQHAPHLANAGRNNEIPLQLGVNKP